MRYFKTIKADIELDNCSTADPETIRKNDARFVRDARRYYTHLDSIAERLGRSAYKFFRFGFERMGLHDGYLLSFSMGDGLGLRNGRLRWGGTQSSIEMKMLNYERDVLHTFKFKNLKKVVVDVPSAEAIWFKPGQLGHIYTYEVISISRKYLRNEWLLDSGGTITIDFEKVVYKQRKVAGDGSRF